MSQTNGLIGSIGSGISRLRSLSGQHDKIAIALVFFAGVITILHKAGVPIPYYAMAFGVSLGIAALFYEMNATTNALRNFWKGRLVGTIGWAFIWVVAFGYSMNQWIGAASENEGAKSNMHKAAFLQTVDTRKQLETAQRAVDRLEERLRMAPIRTAEQAQAAINNAMSHRFWKATDGCKETKGPQTRQFCSDYASAVADKAGATEAVTVHEELKVAKAELATAKAAASNSKVEVSEARNDLVIMTKYMGMNEDDARTLNALGSIIAISLFLSIATMLKELEHLREATPRIAMFSSLRRLLFGSSIDEGKVETIREIRTVKERDPRLDGVQAFLSEFKTKPA